MIERKDKPESHDRESPFEADVIFYKSVIAEPNLKKMRRRVWLSSVLPAGYVLYDLSIVNMTASRDGIRLFGLTEGELLLSFFIAVLYCSVSYFWSLSLRCRGFSTANFLKETWVLCVAGDKRAGFERGIIRADAEHVDSRDLRGTLSGFERNTLVEFIDLFVVPWILPGLVAFVALVLLGIETFS